MSRKIVPVTSMTENNPVLYRNDLGIVKLPIRKQLSIDDKIISTKLNSDLPFKVISYV